MAKDDDKEETKDDAQKGGKKKLIMIALPVVLLLAGAGWYFFLKPAPSTGPVTLPEPTPGAVVPLDPITINLASAHFLKLGMALQPTSAAEAPSGSKALDLAIAQFSGMTVDELSTAKGRNEAKAELVARIKLAYLPEGTDLAVATGSAPAAGAGAASAASAASKSSATAESEGATSKTPELTPESLSSLTGKQVIALADKLTVQPTVYDVYLTEFVMQ